MPDADQGSMRTSHPKGTPSGTTDAHVSNEDRVVAGPNGPERVEGGHVAAASNVYDPHMDSGRHRTDPPKDFQRGDKPDRQNDTGELADDA